MHGGRHACEHEQHQCARLGNGSDIDGELQDVVVVGEDAVKAVAVGVRERVDGDRRCVELDQVVSRAHAPIAVYEGESVAGGEPLQLDGVEEVGLSRRGPEVEHEATGRPEQIGDRERSGRVAG